MKLSIIVPVYNTEKYLSKCLDSLILPKSGETWDYEIVVVNDGSTDSSRSIMADYERRFPGLVRPLDTPNGGLGHARNVGMAAAEGEYLLFVDSDDWLAPGAMEEILKAVEESFDVGIFDFVHVDEAGRELASFSGCDREGTFTLAQHPGLLHCPLNSCNKIWRRSLFADHGFRFPVRLWYEDVATSPNLYLNAKAIRYFPRPWYCYLQRVGSITNTRSADRNLEMITAFDMVLDYYRAQGEFDRYHEELEYMAFYHAYLTSITRVNLIDPANGIQDRLLDNFVTKFPSYRGNRYYLAAPQKYKLLDRLMRKRQWRAVNLLMTANKKLKGR